MTFNLNHKTFINAENTENGEVSGETIFHYVQDGHQIEATYHGGSIRHGHLLGVMTSDDTFSMLYHHLNHLNELRVGQCTTRIEVNADGRIQLIEQWQWLNGDCSQGESVLLEIRTD